jgi:protein translocase SecG subunit
MILAQNQGGGLGEAFGGDNSFHSSRRGVELIMHQLTILFAIVFTLSIILGVMSS